VKDYALLAPGIAAAEAVHHGSRGSSRIAPRGDQSTLLNDPRMIFETTSEGFWRQAFNGVPFTKTLGLPGPSESERHSEQSGRIRVIRDERLY